MIDFNITDEEIEALKNYEEKNYEAINQMLVSDAETDIALLKIEGEDFSYVSFGSSDDLKVGEWGLAVGNPFNLTSTVTAGIVSAKNRANIVGEKQSLQSQYIYSALHIHLCSRLCILVD